MQVNRAVYNTNKKIAQEHKLLIFDQNRPDFSPYGLTCSRWRPSAMKRPDHHNEIELNFLRSGVVTYLFGGKKATVEAGKLSVFWAAIPHQIINFSETADFFVATIPLKTFLQWRLPENFAQPLMQGHFLQDNSSDNPQRDDNMLKCWESDLSKESTDASNTIKSAVTLEMEARLTRFAIGLPATSEDRTTRQHLSSVTDTGLNKVEKMASYIAKNYTQKLTVQQLGELVHLHPNYAMRLFQKTFGATLISYLTLHRVSHAQRLLSTTTLPITEIALQSGFSSMSRFNEAFYRSCGLCPRVYRKSHAL